MRFSNLLFPRSTHCCMSLEAVPNPTEPAKKKGQSNVFSRASWRRCPYLHQRPRNSATLWFCQNVLAALPLPPHGPLFRGSAKTNRKTPQKGSGAWFWHSLLKSFLKLVAQRLSGWATTPIKMAEAMTTQGFWHSLEIYLVDFPAKAVARKRCRQREKNTRNRARTAPWTAAVYWEHTLLRKISPPDPVVD